jgi:ACR3 family arsenite efflux pump ArsB
MSKQFYKDAFGWGFVLWLIGYALGMMLFKFVPMNLIGWIIAPIGTIITLYVAFKKIKGGNFKFYLLVAVVWTAIAVVFDYLFIVKAFKPADGYYKPDVYLYYVLIFSIPLIAGYFRTRQPSDSATPPPTLPETK